MGINKVYHYIYHIIISKPQLCSPQDPFVMGVSPERGPKAGGTTLTITGRNLLTGRPSDLAITVGEVPCSM